MGGAGVELGNLAGGEDEVVLAAGEADGDDELLGLDAAGLVAESQVMP